MSKCATSLPFRRSKHTYLRLGWLRAAWGGCAAGAILVSVIIACVVPPPVFVGWLAPAAHSVFLAYLYWCSMLTGAAPYIMAGSLGAVAAMRLRSAFARRRSLTTCLRYFTPLSAALLCGCDCSLVSFAGALRESPRWLTGFALTWSACCNPVALVCTARILGLRMMFVRLCAGALAAALTAALWTKTSHIEAGDCQAAGADEDKPTDQHGIATYTAAGLQRFSLAASAAAFALVFAPHFLATHASALVAAVAGAVLSPCSNSDALLASALFRLPAERIAFVMAAQGFDVRQLLLLCSHFGLRRAASAGAAAIFATAVACAVAHTTWLP